MNKKSSLSWNMNTRLKIYEYCCSNLGAIYAEVYEMIEIFSFWIKVQEFLIISDCYMPAVSFCSDQ